MTGKFITGFLVVLAVFLIVGVALARGGATFEVGLINSTTPSSSYAYSAGARFARIEGQRTGTATLTMHIQGRNTETVGWTNMVDCTITTDSDTESCGVEDTPTYFLRAYCSAGCNATNTFTDTTISVKE